MCRSSQTWLCYPHKSIIHKKNVQIKNLLWCGFQSNGISKNDIKSSGISPTPKLPPILHLLVISQSRTGVKLNRVFFPRWLSQARSLGCDFAESTHAPHEQGDEALPHKSHRYCRRSPAHFDFQVKATFRSESHPEKRSTFGTVFNHISLSKKKNQTQGVSSNRLVFKQLLGGIFKKCVFLGFSSNSGPNFANAAFGVSSDGRVFINLRETQDCSEKTCQRPGKRNTGAAVKRFSRKRKTGTLLLLLNEHLSKTLKQSSALAVFWNFRVPLVSGQEQGPLKSSRKYVPLTQGNGLNPHHDGSNTERDVPNEFCVLRNKSLSRERDENEEREKKKKREKKEDKKGKKREEERERREKREEKRGEKREETRLKWVSRLIEGTNLATILVRSRPWPTRSPPNTTLNLIITRMCTIPQGKVTTSQHKANKAISECALFPKESWSAATDFEHPRKEKRETWKKKKLFF